MFQVDVKTAGYSRVDQPEVLAHAPDPRLEFVCAGEELLQLCQVGLQPGGLLVLLVEVGHLRHSINYSHFLE